MAGEPTNHETQRIRTVYEGYRSIAGKKWSPVNRGNMAMVRERNARLLGLLKQAGLLPLRNRRILDIGCGGGDLLSFFETQGALPADLFGVDLLPERIEAARHAHPNLNFAAANGERLEFADDRFDLVTLFVVFSSILSEAMMRNLAGEAMRVTRPGGAVVVYDFRVPSPGNRHTRAIRRAEIAGLFPGWRMYARSVTLLPPLARRMGALTRSLYPVLAALPLMRTHNLILMCRPAGRG